MISLRQSYVEIFHRSRSLFTATEKDALKKNTFISFKQEISVKLMSKSDLATALTWAETEGWCPGKYELDALYNADPNGYYMLHVDGEPVASLACTRHSEQFAFLGLFIVLPNFRDQGYGKVLWDIVLGRGATFNSLGLNAVMDQIHRYKKSGFSEDSLITRWKINLDKIPRSQGVVQNNLTLCDAVPHEKILSYDAKSFTNSRKMFLDGWLKIPESRTLAALNKDGEVLGYGSINKTTEGYKIAPFIADNHIVADSLYKGFCHIVGKQKHVFIDMPNVNPNSKKLVEQFKMEKMFDTMRMYKGTPPHTNEKKIIATTSLEIGY